MSKGAVKFSKLPWPLPPGFKVEAVITLREWFAGQALTGLLAANGPPGLSKQDYAKLSFNYADAMLTESGKEKLEANEHKRVLGGLL